MTIIDRRGTTRSYFMHSALALAAILLITMVFAPSGAHAQTSTFGSIEGTVTDESRGILPGVTLTLTSPALQVPSLTTVTDTEGRYRFADLRVGTYRIESELAGFRRFAREGLQLDTGFVARVDIIMSLGSIEETVTVSGASPVIDLATTSGGQTINTELVTKALPMYGHVSDLVRVTPGLTGGVGGRQASATGLGQGFNMSVAAYGQPGNTSMIEDFQIHEITQPANLGATDQMDVRAFGNTAEIQRPGVALNYVFSSGGNEFRGRINGAFMNDSLAGDNLDDTLRGQGFRQTEKTLMYRDVGAQLGGRIIRDKLWFFASARQRANERSLGGFVLDAGPDGRFLTGDEPSAFPKGNQDGEVLKLSYQMTPKYQLVGFMYHDWAVSQGAVVGGLLGGANARTIPWEHSSVYGIEQYFWNGQFRGTPSNNLAVDVKGGWTFYTTLYRFPPDVDLTKPSSFDRNIGVYSGLSISNGINVNNAERTGITGYYQSVGNMTFVPDDVWGGNHQFKVGYRVKLSTIGGGAPSHRVCSCLHVFDNGVPVELVTLSLPVETRNRDNIYGVYLTDQWEVSSRVTVNLGMRVERQRSFIPSQSQSAGQFIEAQSFPAMEVGSWNTWAPRAAVAWDPTGSAKNVVKVTYGRFNHEIIGANNTLAAMYNPIGPRTVTYRWTDPNRNGRYDQGEVDLSLNGPAFVNITSGTNTVPLSPDVKIPHSHEFAASLEREIVPGMGGRILYVYKRLVGEFVTINSARPYSAFNIPLSRRDPGPDGLINTSDDGGMVTIYDYDPAFRGAAFVASERVNTPSDRADVAQTIEVSANRRLAGRWSAMASASATKFHAWLVPVPQSPNDDLFPLDETWDTTVRANGSYLVPGDILLGGTLSVMNGVKGQRTYVFRAADPLGGTPLRQQTTVTARLEPFGEQIGPVRTYFDMRVGKRFTLRGGEFDLNLDFINALNANAAQAMTFVSGPTYGQIATIPEPRALRIGASFSF